MWEPGETITLKENGNTHRPENSMIATIEIMLLDEGLEYDYQTISHGQTWQLSGPAQI